MIYLDNSATTQLSPNVREAMEPFLREEFGNPSSIYTLGVQARVAIEEARETVAKAIGAAPRDITFTGSGTEANNAAIQGTFFQHLKQGREASAFRAISNHAEHHAVLHPLDFVASLSATIDYAEIDATGHVSLESIEALASEHTSLVTTMLVNNEVGAINDIATITATLRKRAPNAIIHTDAVQALGKIPLNVSELGVDLLTLSAHKIRGPKGIGALYTRTSVEWIPLIHGGAQERNRRAGTESVALAVGFATAIAEMETNREADTTKRTALANYLLVQLQSIPAIRINSATDGSAVSSIINFSFDEVTRERLDADAVLIRFDLAGIAVANGSACTSGSQQPSHVLLAMGKGSDISSKSIRVSIAAQNTFDDIDRFIATLTELIQSVH